jgi:protein-tyrosine phosphatase
MISLLCTQVYKIVQNDRVAEFTMSKTSVLFVCLGNICRSPMAESIFRHKVKDAGLNDQFLIESAGTGDWHVGDNPDPRTINVLRQNGITEFSRARQVSSSDFSRFDYVIGMDLANVRDLHRWKGAVLERVSLMSHWNPNATLIEVPDPYYGDASEFDHVFDILEESTDALLTKLKNP